MNDAQPTKEPKKQFKPPQPVLHPLNGTPEEVKAFNDAISQDNFVYATTFIMQVGFLCSVLRTNTILVKYRAIGDVFEVSRQKVCKCHKKFLRGEGIDGRPPLLSTQELSLIENEIIKLHQNSIYPTIDDITKFIFNTFNKSLYKDTVRHIIRYKFTDKFKNVLGVPMEDNRLNSNIIEIEENINNLRRSIIGIPIEFLFNLDEMGVSEYEDGRSKTVIVPINYSNCTAPYPVSRKEKHCTCLACINPCKLFCSPQFTVQRSSLDSEIYTVLSPQNIQVVKTEKGYINSQSFTFWLQTQFLPELRELRKKNNYYGPAVIIMDGASSHVTSIRSLNLLQENIKVHFLVPHSSDQTQPLDLSVFGVSKMFMSNYKYNQNFSRQTNQIIKVYTALLQSTTTLHCRAAFRAIGIDTQISISNNGVQLFATFNLLLIKKVRDYQISHITQLINSNLPLTPNQTYIYNCHKKTENPTKSSSRMPIPDFSNKVKRNLLPVPYIFYANSKF